LDAKLLWADVPDQLLMANCVDQFDLASIETLWVWNGSDWEELSNDGPPANVVTGFGWDPDRDVLVRYGGIPLPKQDCSAATWEWDMTAWREIEAVPAEACDHIELAWDPSVGRMLLVGGGRAQDLASGTWALEGTRWTALTDDGPAPRAHHGLATDETNGRVLLYGGLDNSQLFDDLWAWDGSAWEDIGVGGSGPGRRSHHGFAVGPAGALLFGGATSTSTFDSLVDDTWLLVDGSWSQIEGPGPTARGLPALGYDPDRDVFVLFPALRYCRGGQDQCHYGERLVAGDSRRDAAGNLPAHGEVEPEGVLVARPLEPRHASLLGPAYGVLEHRSTEPVTDAIGLEVELLDLR